MKGGDALKHQTQTANKDAKAAVYNVLQTLTASQNFVHKNDIFSMVKNQMDYSTFEAAITDLTADGAIYTSYKQDHYMISSWMSEASVWFNK